MTRFPETKVAIVAEQIADFQAALEAAFTTRSIVYPSTIGQLVQEYGMSLLEANGLLGATEVMNVSEAQEAPKLKTQA